jgi:hypothetical protein
VLEEPLPLKASAAVPTAVFCVPLELSNKATVPTAVLESAMFSASAPAPTPVLKVPVLSVKMFGNDEIRMSNAERTTRFLNQETRNRGNGISEIDGKGVQGSAERVGRRVSFKLGNGRKASCGC